MKKSTLHRMMVWFVVVSVTLYNTVFTCRVAYAVVVRGGTRTSVNRNVNVNQNVNVNRSVNVDVDHDHDYHPFAAAAVAGAAAAVTSAVIGSIVNTKPPNAVPVVVGGVTYLQVGSTWYQPQYAGTQVTYVVVQPPR
jgi:hypothetical protein